MISGSIIEVKIGAVKVGNSVLHLWLRQLFLCLLLLLFLQKLLNHVIRELLVHLVIFVTDTKHSPHVWDLAQAN